MVRKLEEEDNVNPATRKEHVIVVERRLVVYHIAEIVMENIKGG